MVQEEEIFNKKVDNVVKKPKRKLTEKQLANLALGREKMRLKRELAKKNKEQKQMIKEDNFEAKLVKETQKKKRVQHKEKRRTLKEINAEKEQQILQRLEKQQTEKDNKKSARMDLFTTLKVKCLEQAKTVAQYNEIKAHLDGIDEDTLHNDNKLKDYAKSVMKPYIQNKHSKTHYTNAIDDKTEEKKEVYEVESEDETTEEK